ncbi:metallophosphoesterase [Alkaliphilus transvaalensis]|uniref:metallophosphoesterase n=1 Tax=Alkaliphilus transvaalensis TaxID=114628 RepID=UPI000683FA2B|nr:metallophosphoesterase [Alkaliphilus transvaalensis]
MRKFTIIEKIKCFILDHPYIPDEFRQKKKGPLLLHISDTPSNIFPFIKKLLQEINPQYIVHTGDIVDNIKLETDERLLITYMEELEKIVTLIEENSNAKIYYAIGNHDDEESLKNYMKKGYVIKNGIVNIEGYKFYINHYPDQIPKGVDYYLFGHNFSPHYQKNQHIGLNGLISVNIIDLESREIHQIQYPIATNRFRRMEKGKISI